MRYMMIWNLRFVCFQLLNEMLRHGASFKATVYVFFKKKTELVFSLIFYHIHKTGIAYLTSPGLAWM